MKRSILLLLCLAAALAAASGTVSADSSPWVITTDATLTASGDLDPGFGGGGLVTTAFAGGDAALEAVALQPDGKIVAAGWSRDTNGGSLSFMLTRYNGNGSLDSSFGVGGIVRTSVGSSSAANAVSIENDGKIVAAGFTQDWPGSFALARFDSTGTLDSTFGSGGKVITDIGQANSQINAVAVQPDGKIVAGGGNSDQGNAANFAVARYQSNGSLDTSFGSGGVTFTNFSGLGGLANSLLLQPDGRIIEAGAAGVASYPFQGFGLVRFNSNGSLDTSFGSGGKVTTSFDGGATAWEVARQADGQLVAAGAAVSNTGNGGFGLARYNPDGSLDTSFGAGGEVYTDFGSYYDAAHAVAVRGDGTIVAAGYWVTPTVSGDFALAQYLPDGSLDPSFGVGGKVTTDFAGGSEVAEAVAIQTDGKIVAAGVTSSVTGISMFALARYLDGTVATGTITVVKHLVPAYDQSRFNLRIDGTTYKSNAGNNDTTGQVAVAPGVHTISETAGAGAILSNYVPRITCSDGSAGYGTSLSGVHVTAGQAITCTITNTRKLYRP